MATEEAYISRANAAYYREMTKMQRQGVSLDAHAYTAMVFHNDKDYVVLTNRYRTLAVYRIGNNGLLRRLKRWPKAVEEM